MRKLLLFPPFSEDILDYENIVQLFKNPYVFWILERKPQNTEFVISKVLELPILDWH